MKWTLFVLVALGVSNMAFAKKNQDEGFEQRKAKLLEHLDRRISETQKMKTCVQTASDADALRACRTSHHESMKEMKSRRKEMRKEMREKKKAQKVQKTQKKSEK